MTIRDALGKLVLGQDLSRAEEERHVLAEIVDGLIEGHPSRVDTDVDSDADRAQQLTQRAVALYEKKGNSAGAAALRAGLESLG